MGSPDLGWSDARRAVKRLRYFFIDGWRCVYFLVCNGARTQRWSLILVVLNPGWFWSNLGFERLGLWVNIILKFLLFPIG